MKSNLHTTNAPNPVEYTRSREAADNTSHHEKHTDETSLPSLRPRTNVSKREIFWQKEYCILRMAGKSVYCMIAFSKINAGYISLSEREECGRHDSRCFCVALPLLSRASTTACEGTGRGF